MPNPEQGHEKTVAACLHEHALSRINKHHGEVGARGAGDHVARVLLMTRRVGYDEFTTMCREESVRNIDGDALLTLGSQPIDEQGEIDLTLPRSHPGRITGQGSPVVFKYRFRFVQQPADERGFVIIHRATGDQPQQRLAFFLGESRRNVFVSHTGIRSHQK